MTTHKRYPIDLQAHLDALGIRQTEAARRLKVSGDVVRKWCRQGYISEEGLGLVRLRGGDVTILGVDFYA